MDSLTSMPGLLDALLPGTFDGFWLAPGTPENCLALGGAAALEQTVATKAAEASVCADHVRVCWAAPWQLHEVSVNHARPSFVFVGH